MSSRFQLEWASPSQSACRWGPPCTTQALYRFLLDCWDDVPFDLKAKLILDTPPPQFQASGFCRFELHSCPIGELDQVLQNPSPFRYWFGCDSEVVRECHDGRLLDATCHPQSLSVIVEVPRGETHVELVKVALQDLLESLRDMVGLQCRFH